MGFPWAIAAGSASSAVSVFGQREANATNIKLSREQRDFEEKMANTAYQRKRADLEAAGYNPMLGAEGVGAVTPSQNAPSVENEYNEAARSMQQSAMQVAQLRNINANTVKTMAEADKAKVDATVAQQWQPFEAETRARINALSLDIKKATAQNEIKLSNMEVEQVEKQLPHLVQIAQNQAEAGELDLAKLRAESGMNETTFGKILPYLRAILGIGETGTSIYREISPTHRRR